MTTNEYHILSPVYFIIRDAPDPYGRLRFHINTGDYFAMLATALGFVEEALENRHENQEDNVLFSREYMLLRDIRKDLLYLHSHYEIIEKIQ